MAEMKLIPIYLPGNSVGDFVWDGEKVTLELKKG